MGSTWDPQRPDQRSTWSPGKKKAPAPRLQKVNKPQSQCVSRAWGHGAAVSGTESCFLPWPGAQHRHWQRQCQGLSSWRCCCAQRIREISPVLGVEGALRYPGSQPVFIGLCTPSALLELFPLERGAGDSSSPGQPCRQPLPLQEKLD